MLGKSLLGRPLRTVSEPALSVLIGHTVSVTLRHRDIYIERDQKRPRSYILRRSQKPSRTAVGQITPPQTRIGHAHTSHDRCSYEVRLIKIRRNQKCIPRSPNKAGDPVSGHCSSDEASGRRLDGTFRRTDTRRGRREPWFRKCVEILASHSVWLAFRHAACLEYNGWFAEQLPGQSPGSRRRVGMKGCGTDLSSARTPGDIGDAGLRVVRHRAPPPSVRIFVHRELLSRVPIWSSGPPARWGMGKR